MPLHEQKRIASRSRSRQDGLHFLLEDVSDRSHNAWRLDLADTIGLAPGTETSCGAIP